ncbi:MAG TPA: GntR family transcriptional regulator [Ruminiclostridium sp.]|nr:GntR family transcriptional regulator [Ruminiclostridium sp.]
MTEEVSSPLYLQIALDIAARIARGEFKEKSKIYGRSVMSSEYGVSPETIRRSLKLLSHMRVVDIKQGSGAVILSKKNAQEYVDRFKERSNTRSLQLQLKNLVAEQSKINKKIVNITNTITRATVRWSNTNPLQNFEIDVHKNSPVVGKSISELNFWHATGATIVAIRRSEKIILSPGPYFVMSVNDTIVFIGNQSAVNAVTMFISPKK